MATILAIETSCDDTSVAVVSDFKVLSNQVSSQTLHDQYGGIVPELASREHVKGIAQIADLALRQAHKTIQDIDAIAVTNGPGLAGSLLVGLHFAKGLCLRYAKPLFPINHIEAHIYSAYIEHSTLEFPSICLVVSGGHTSLVFIRSVDQFEIIGSTRDDAAGEAFDKTAKMMGLGYPGGPLIDALSRTGDPKKFHFPRGLSGSNAFDFSFSGLKTAVRLFLEKNEGTVRKNDVAASVQEAIVDVLVDKSIRAAHQYDVKTICIAGGVSANSRLREKLLVQCKRSKFNLLLPSLQYCVDNAAMIGFLAELRMQNGTQPSSLNVTVNPKPIRMTS
ncbi:MAG: tRNA (adenosine(37)-N6)-threonylcarbamoyltransferase complex transferase subunit TsaD [Ignavibacteria bacterium]|nr:tRNA (adenosine(37)-N6)-threonylcarbamoyltransferase complex transferase subunit TsaD [Ignavibacteria bacterium]